MWSRYMFKMVHIHSSQWLSQNVSQQNARGSLGRGKPGLDVGISSVTVNETTLKVKYRRIKQTHCRGDLDLTMLRSIGSALAVYEAEYVGYNLKSGANCSMRRATPWVASSAFNTPSTNRIYWFFILQIVQEKRSYKHISTKTYACDNDPWIWYLVFQLCIKSCVHTNELF